jgi:hypothetical protein
MNKSMGFVLVIGCILSSLANIPAATQTQAPVASVSSLPESRILPPPAAYSWPNGDRYVYSVEWQLFHAGTATVKMQRSDSGGHLTATADSAGVANTIFKVHDLFEADLDPHTFCTLRISKHNEEGPHRREIRIVFDYTHAKSEVDNKDLKTSQLKHEEHDVPPCVTDVMSGFYYVASLPLAPGLSQTFPVNDNGKTTDVRIVVEARDKIKGPSGTYQTVRVRAEPLSGPMKNKGVLWVWFTDDGRHVPVQMKSKLGFATLLFQLQRIDPPTGG